MKQLESFLVRELRTWRPEVVVTHRAGAEGGSPVAGLVERIVLQSIDAAADPAAAIELTSSTGLGPWAVKRAYGIARGDALGDEAVNTGRFVARLGASLADWSAPARRLLNVSQSPGPVELELLLDRTANGAEHGMFGGIELSAGGEARRPGASDIVANVDELKRAAARRRQMQELLERTEGSLAWVAQVEQLTSGVDMAGGGELLFRLADGYRRTGRLDLAADTYYLLVRRFPDHPLAEQALVWLVQYYASGEASRTSGRAPVVDLRPEVHGDEIDARSTARSGVEQVAAVVPPHEASTPVVGLSRDDRLRRALQLGEYLETTRPLVYAEPAVRFPLVAAERDLGFANPAKRYFLTLGQLPENDPWRRAAVTEQWLSRPTEAPPPKVLGHCRRTGERPHLDGRLDEPCWRTADPLPLVSQDHGWTTGDAIVKQPPIDEKQLADQQEPASIPGGRAELAASPSDPAQPPPAKATMRLAYDAEFLYLAVSCPKTNGVDDQGDNRPRTRDADLTEHDRVSVRLDVDRDYATWFELVVDQRGWTREACVGEAAWNPAWYVAAADDTNAWTVEAAVPLSELVSEAPSARQVWAAAVRRTIPRVGYETWSGGAEDFDSPEAFGLLIFE
jgi:hypothetical protein